MGHKDKFNLKEGEYICPDCGGTGINKNSKMPNKMASSCFTCWGSGKLDWIEMIMGKRPRKLKGRWTINVSKEIQSFRNSYTKQELVDKFSEQIANDIDKEIMDILTNKGG